MQCIACRKTIPEGASVCTECGAHQARWKNWLPYLGGGVAAITLVASALAYLVNTSITIVERLTWNDEIKIIQLQVPGRITIKNAGDGDVYLESYRVRALEINHESGGPLDQVIKAGVFKRIPAGGKFNGGPIGPVSDEDWELLKANVVPGVIPLFLGKDSAFLDVILSRFEEPPRVFEGSLEIVYHSLAQDSTDVVSFGVKGVFLKLDTERNVKDVFVPDNTDRSSDQKPPSLQ